MGRKEKEKTATHGEGFGVSYLGRERTCSYGVLSVSSASTRHDWSVSGTRNGGWYSNAVTMPEPKLCFWCRNQTTAETPTIATTLRMTRAESTALGSEGDD